MTFYVNGSERVRIDSSGRLGLGTSSPSQVLDVSANDARFNLTSTGSGQTVGISIKGGGGGGDTYNYIESLDSAGAQKWYIGSNGTANTLAFKTNGNNERMRIDSSGNVGIGTTSPYSAGSDHSALTIAGKSGTSAGFLAFRDTAGNADAVIFSDNGNLFINADYDNTTASSNIIFRVDGSSEKARIDSSGRLLVGTSSFTGEASAVLEGSSAGEPHKHNFG